MSTPNDDETSSGARARAIIEQGRSVWDVADEYALEALIVRHDDLDCADEKTRSSAARDLLYAWSRLPPRPALPPEKGITQEEFRARMDAAYENPQVQEYLRAKGCILPKQEKTN